MGAQGRRRMIGGGALAALWLLCGWIPFLASAVGGSLGALGRIVPSPMNGQFFGAPPGWAILLHVVAALLVGGAYVVAAALLDRRHEGAFPAAWLAAVIAGFLAGGVLDLGAMVAAASGGGFRSALGAGGSTTLAVFWAFVVGWIPALIVRRRPSSTTGASAPSTRVVAVSGALVAVLALALPLVSAGAQEAAQRTAVAEREATPTDPDGAAAPDPSAPGAPVSSVAPVPEPAAPGDCTAEQIEILAPPADGATGHRLQSLEAVNTSEAACVLNGYPDVEFGDQNGHRIEVDLQRGSSFMAADPGAAPVTLASGESARAGIGWDANSTRGQLVARSLHVAVRAGEARLTWTEAFDVVPGTVLHVTAWHAQSAAG